MPVIPKTIDDIAKMWEREGRIHLYPHLSIEWAIKKPGEEKALLGVMRHDSAKKDGEYSYEVWELLAT